MKTRLIGACYSTGNRLAGLSAERKDIGI